MPDARRGVAASFGEASPERIKLFWKTGCSSCMRVKEFLAGLAIDFDSINLSERPEQLETLARLGARSIPVVAVGSHFALAEDLGNVATLLGLELRPERLSPEELVAKQDGILRAACDAVLAIPHAALAHNLPNRDRSYRQLAHHIFRIPEAFLEAAAGQPLVEAMFKLQPEPDMSAENLADYGERVRQRFRAWWEREPDRGGVRTIEAYYGDRSLLVVLERTVWHSAQHARQLEHVALGALGIRAPRPLTRELLAGLPLPQAVYF